MTERIDRLNRLVQEEVANALARDYAPPAGVLVTVVRARVSRTTEHAAVWVSVLPDQRGPEIIDALNARIREFQGALNERLVLRKVPKLMFRLDHREEKVREIGGILDALDGES